MIRLVLFIIAISFLTGCKDPKKGKLLPPDKMQSVMWDVLQADAYAELYIKKDSTKNLAASSAVLQQKVFNIHHISKDDFYSSYEYYNARPDEMRIILDSVSAKAERKRNDVIQKQYKKKEE